MKSSPRLYKQCSEYCGKRGYHNRSLCPDTFTDDDPNTESFCAQHFDNVTCVGDAGVTVAGNATCPGDISKMADVKLTLPLQTVSSQPNVSLQPQNANVSLQSFTQSAGQSGAHPTQSFLVTGERVLLQTAIVPVCSADGKKLINARVILDSASQRTFMTTKLAQQLNLSCEYENIYQWPHLVLRRQEVLIHMLYIVNCSLWMVLTYHFQLMY